MILFQLFNLLFMLLANLRNLLLEVVYDGGLGCCLEVEISHLALNIIVNVFNQVDKRVFMQTLGECWIVHK